MKKLLLLILIFACGTSYAQRFNATKPFITAWKVSADDLKVSFQRSRSPEISSAPERYYDFEVDWGDGIKENNKYNHTYKEAGDYQISIKGKFAGISFRGHVNDPNPQLQTVIAWGNNQWMTMNSMFYKCTSLKSFEAPDKPNLSHTTDMSSMFNGATSFNGQVGDWNVANVNNMTMMFFGASVFNQDVSKWKVDKVIKCTKMFLYAKAFKKNLAAWTLPAKANVTYMFGKTYPCKSGPSVYRSKYCK